MEIRLTCLPYDRTLPLLRGDVSVRGVSLVVAAARSAQEATMAMLNLKVDVAEMSLATYVLAREAGSPLIALPLFPARRFLQPYIFCARGADMDHLGQLVGKRVGLPQFWMTSSVWHRGILRDLYGVNQEEVIWWTTAPERLPSMGVPGGVPWQREADGSSLDALLLEGQVDCVMTARKPRWLAEQPNRVRLLFANVARAQRDYYERTGIFPIMHTVVLRAELWRSHPWVAEAVCEAFAAAKEQGLRTLGDAAGISLPLAASYLEETRALFGEDPWPYGLSRNRGVLETFLRYLREQGGIGDPVPVEDLFAENVQGVFD